MKNPVHGAVAPRARAARHQEAEAAYREALDAHPSHPYALENLASLCESLGLTAAARARRLSAAAAMTEG